MPAVPALLFAVPVAGALLGAGAGTLERARVGRRIVPAALHDGAEVLAKAIVARLLPPLEAGAGDPEHLARGVDRLLDLLERELQDPARVDALADQVAGIVKAVAAQRLPELLATIDDPERRQQVVAGLEDRLNQFLGEVQISPQVADFVADQLMGNVFTPDNVRTGLVWLLADEHVEVIADHLRERAGMLRFVFSMVDPQSLLVKLRDQLTDHPEGSNRLMAGLIGALRVEDRLRTALREFKPRDLPRDLLSRFSGQAADLVRQAAGGDAQALAGLVAELDLREPVRELLRALPPGFLVADALAVIRPDLTTFLRDFLAGEVAEALARDRSVDRIAANLRALPADEAAALLQQVAGRHLDGLVVRGAAWGFAIGAVTTALSWGLLLVR